MKLILCLIGACIITSAHTQNCDLWSWASSDNGFERNECHGVEVDGFGNTYVAGWFDSDTLIIGGMEVINSLQDVPGAGDVYVAKLDAQGNALWVRSAGGSDSDWCWAMNIDNAGNVMITGEFYSSSITFGSTTLTNSGLSDIFIATYDADGNPLWARKVGAGGSDRGYGAAFDIEGNALVTGDFEGTVNFGATSISSTNNGDDVFIVKYDSAGNELWAMGFGGAGSETGSGIVADDTGNIYACGWYYYDEFQFGGDSYPYSDLGDVFVLQVSAEGNPGWCHTFGNTSNEFAHYIECDVNNNLIVCGDFFSASLNIGGTNLTNSGNMDGFFVKYTNDGNQQWAKKCVFSQESDYASCITSDNVGNLYVTGHAGKANTQFGNGITVAQEGFFLTRYDTNGTAQWAYGDGGDIPSFAAWDQGFGVSTMNGITSVGGNFMSNALFFGYLEVAHTADFGNVQAFYAQYLTGEAPEILDIEETVDLCLNATLEEDFFLAPNVLPYTLQWYFNDAPFDGSDTTILTIPAVTIDDEGTYYCVVTNACGSAQSDVTTVFVNLPPEIPTLAEDEFCISDLAVMLPAGTWSGPGVNGSIFYPGLAGVGNHPLIVSLLSPEDCESIDKVIVSVYPQFYMGEDASDTVCVQLTNYDLSALLSEDANANGLWYLPGFNETDPQFSPAEFGVGEHEFWYFNPEFGPCDPDTAFFFVYVDACISVDENEQPQITFYPNPADETLIVKLHGMLDIPVEILDATGRIIISQMPVTQHSIINISTLVPGIYTLRHGSGQQKLIVE